jgi:hypothetical protein
MQPWLFSLTVGVGVLLALLWLSWMIYWIIEGMIWVCRLFKNFRLPRIKWSFWTKKGVPMGKRARLSYRQRLLSDAYCHILEELRYQKLLTDKEVNSEYSRLARIGLPDMFPRKASLPAPSALTKRIKTYKLKRDIKARLANGVYKKKDVPSKQPEKAAAKPKNRLEEVLMQTARQKG